MNNLRATDVLVAGGGPAGLAAAIAARQAGFEVAVIDCALPPIDKACGEGIMPDGLAALAALGVRVDPSQAAPFRGIRFINGPREVEASFPGGVGYGIRRTLLHQWLVDRASECGVSLHWGRRVTGLSSDGLLVENEVVSSRWLIGADGQNSKLRKLSGLEPARRPPSRFGFRRHYRIAPWSEYVEVHWSNVGQMYVTPVAEDQVCVALITSRNGLRFDAALPSFSSVGGQVGTGHNLWEARSARRPRRAGSEMCRREVSHSLAKRRVRWMPSLARDYPSRFSRRSHWLTPCGPAI